MHERQYNSQCTDLSQAKPSDPAGIVGKYTPTDIRHQAPQAIRHDTPNTSIRRFAKSGQTPPLPQGHDPWHNLPGVNQWQNAYPPIEELPIPQDHAALHRSPLQRAQEAWNQLFAANNDNNDMQVVDGDRPIQLSLENQRENVSWGDELVEKLSTNTRVLYVMNVNGLSLDNRSGQFDDVCKMAKETQADILCCQETNVDVSQPLVRHVLYHTARQHWQQRSRLATGSTPTTFASMHKPGGTLILSAGNVTGPQLISSDADGWGRWTSQTFRGQQDVKITVISAYQVVRDTPEQGVITAASDQRSILLMAQDPLNDPRKAFKRDITNFLQQYLARDEEIILVGDFNETLGEDFDGIATIARGCGLANIMAHGHSMPPPATFARGRQCIDYGFATPHVIRALRQCGYEQFSARFPTDHRSYFSILIRQNCSARRRQYWLHPQTGFSSRTTSDKLRNISKKSTNICVDAMPSSGHNS